MHFVAVADAVSLVSRNISRKSCDNENTHLETTHTHTHLSYMYNDRIDKARQSTIYTIYIAFVVVVNQLTQFIYLVESQMY